MRIKNLNQSKLYQSLMFFGVFLIAVTFTSCGGDDDDIPPSALNTFLEKNNNIKWKYVGEFDHIKYLVFKNNQRLPFEIWGSAEGGACYRYFDPSKYEIEVLENSATDLIVKHSGGGLIDLVYKFKIEGNEVILESDDGKIFKKTNDNLEEFDICFDAY